MQFAQTALFQIDAAKLDEAQRPGGLLPALDEHRGFLEQQPGFVSMRVTRSVNPSGNVLVVVETRWQDAQSLLEYETREPNVASIINQHQDIIVPDSLQVLDMEALRTETPPETIAQETTRRLLLPLLIPAGALAFALLVIYGLSRVYLELPNAAAVGLAAGISLGVLLVAWFIATHPQIQAWQVASMFVVAAAVLTGGAVFALVHEDEGEAAHPPPANGAPPDNGEPPPPPTDGTVFETRMIPTIQFDTDVMTFPAETEITVRAINEDGTVPHNWAMYESREVAESEGPAAAIALTEVCSACTEEVTFTTPPAGEYFFRCDIHPVQMVGTVVVE